MAKKILIVDDMVFMRAALKKILEASGHVVIGEAENGEDGVKKFKALKPDIVTMDITMPIMDGLAALEAIRKIDGTAKVIMVSAMGQEKTIVNAIKMGAKNFIVKPFKPEKVAEVISKL